jgi:hypothetical protein
VVRVASALLDILVVLAAEVAGLRTVMGIMLKMVPPVLGEILII